MKLLIYMLSLYTILVSCNTTKNKNNSDLYTKTTAPITITYVASSRGVYDFIEISEQNTTVSNDRARQNYTTIKTNPEDWAKIINELNNVELSTLKELTIPSDKRASDAAKYTYIRIKKGAQTFSTPSYDHDNPPKVIKSFNDLLVVIKDRILKSK